MDDDRDVLTRLVDDYERLGILYGFATGLAPAARERINAVAQRDTAIDDLLRHLDTIYPRSSQTQSALEKRDVINLVRRKLATEEPTREPPIPSDKMRDALDVPTDDRSDHLLNAPGLGQGEAAERVLSRWANELEWAAERASQGLPNAHLPDLLREIGRAGE